MGSSRQDLKKESIHTHTPHTERGEVGEGQQSEVILFHISSLHPICTLGRVHTSTQIFFDVALRRIGSNNVCTYGKQSQKESPLKCATEDCRVLCKQIFNEYILLLRFPHNFVLVYHIASSVTLPSPVFILP